MTPPVVGRRAGLALALIATAVTAGPAARAAGAQRTPPAPDRALLDRHCVTCHNAKARIAGLALDELDVNAIPARAEIWEKVVRKLRAGAMPPPGPARPDPQAVDRFASSIEAALDQAAAVAPNPGRTEALHRLNRAEYHNAIRDLLALEVDVASLLPADDGSYGFDNMAGVLRLSPVLVERYLSAAQKIGRTAVGSVDAPVTAETFRLASDLPQYERIDGLPFGTRGGVAVQYTFPVDAEYEIRIRLGRNPSDELATFAEAHDVEISLDGRQLRVFSVAPPATPAAAGEPDRPARRAPRSRDDADAAWQIVVPVKAGPHELRVTFFRQYAELRETLREPFLRPYTGITTGDTRYQPHLGSVTITGPYNVGGAGDTPSRRRIFVCRPERSDQERGCARTIVATLARRAYRRPADEADVQTLLSFFDQGREESGTFDGGIQRALERLLVSPDFLFRAEIDRPAQPPGAPYRLNGLELASRLSFFLWSSIPDDPLLDAARAGRLSDPATLAAEVRRMLADARAGALVENFADQWLYLRNLATTVPDESLFPNFDESVRQAFRRETELLVESVLRENRSVLDLLTANYTFLNERLARHYGIPGVSGSQFRRVTLAPDSHRGGLLTQGSILTVTSYATRTSPVVRGKWILENIFGSPPPPPPPNVPTLRETDADGAVLSMRERMARHRRSPVCASCHSRMDPLGLSLEHYDAVGQWRVRGESGQPIDASGVLPDGTAFEGVEGLRAALTARPDRFVTTVTEKLLAYALGRGLEHYDAPAVRRIVRDASRDGYRLSSLVLGIVTSTPFEMRKSSPHGT